MTSKILTLTAVLLTAVLLTASMASADIYHCKDEYGRSVFKDTECSGGESTVEKMADKKLENVSSFSSINMEFDESQRVIYRGGMTGRDTRFVRVAIYEETDEYLTLEVVGYFSGSPTGTMEFRAVPNINWSYSGDVHATKAGFVRAYTRISLNSKAKEVELSDVLTLQLWHYSPKNGASFLGTLSVPFKKEWHKKSA